jgi:hypothetical protein
VQQVADERGRDEPGPAGDEDPLGHSGRLTTHSSGGGCS